MRIEAAESIAGDEGRLAQEALTIRCGRSPKRRFLGQGRSRDYRQPGRKILHDVEAAVAPEGREARGIEGRIEQVAPVRGGLHQRFEGLFRARVVSDIFSDVR